MTSTKQSAVVLEEQIQIVDKDQESTTFIRNDNLSGKITHIKYQWVTDPNVSKIIDLSLVPDSLVDSLIELNKSKNINLMAPRDHDKEKIIIIFREILALIIEQIENKIFSGLVKGEETDAPLSKGFKKYLYYLEYDPILKAEYQKISDLINLINYPPLILSVYESKFSILPGEQDEHTTAGEAEYIRLQAIAGLRTIINALVRKKCHLPVRNVIQGTISDKTSRNLKTIFIPHDKDNRMIYVSPEEKREYEVFHPLELYYGWRYLSDSPLTLYAIENMPFNPPIRKIEGIYIIPTMSRYNSAFNRASLEISNLVARGYLALNLEMPDFRILDHSLDPTAFMDHRMGIYSNLVARFGHKMISPRTDYIFNINRENKGLFKWCELINTCLSDNSENKSLSKNLPIEIIIYGPPIIQSSLQADQIGFLASWLDDSVDNIIHNKLPVVTFRGAWQGIENVSKSEIMARLKYVAYMAYHVLVLNHQYLSSSVLLVDVLEDLSILAPLTSQEEMKEFRSEIERILFQDNYLKWSIFVVANQSELLATRLILREKFPRVSTFGVGLPKEAKKSLYLIASQRIDPVFLDDISSLSGKYLQEFGSELNYYLENVPIANPKKSTKTYIDRNVFLRSYDSISEEIDLNDPITPKSLSKIIFYPEGLMGLFNIDLPAINLHKEIHLKGLYKNPPSKELVHINFGRVVVEGFLPADTFSNEWVMTVNVKLFEDGSETELSKLKDLKEIPKQFRIIPLFDLSYRRINKDPQGRTTVIDYSSKNGKTSSTKFHELSKLEKDFAKQTENVVNWLWVRGQFISPWGKALIQNDDIKMKMEIEPYSLIEINDILKNGYQEPDSGEKAVNYLNQMVRSSS